MMKKVWKEPTTSRKTDYDQQNCSEMLCPLVVQSVDPFAVRYSIIYEGMFADGATNAS